MKCEQEVVEEWVQQLPQVIPALIQLVIEGGPTEKEAAEQLKEQVDDIIKNLKRLINGIAEEAKGKVGKRLAEVIIYTYIYIYIYIYVYVYTCVCVYIYNTYTYMCDTCLYK